MVSLGRANAATTIALLLLLVILPGCSISGSGTTIKPEAATASEVLEISLMSGGGVTYTTGNGHSEEVTFRRDGTAEMRSEVTEKLVQRPAIIKQARLSTDQFDQLAKTIEKNGFFDKKENEGHVEDAWQNLKVITSTGEKTLETFGRESDPQIRAMIDAVNVLERGLQWEEVK